MKELADLPTLVKEEEAARHLRVPMATLKHERDAGRLKCKRLAGRVYYTQDQLAAWLAQADEGEDADACPEGTAAPASSGMPGASSTKSPTPPAADHGVVERARQIAAELKPRSPTSSSPKPPSGPARPTLTLVSGTRTNS